MCKDNLINPTYHVGVAEGPPDVEGIAEVLEDEDAVVRGAAGDRGGEEEGAAQPGGHHVEFPILDCFCFELF